MNNIVTKIQLLTVILIFLFTSCQKEENYTGHKTNKGNDPIEEEYYDIDKLSETSGVNIRELINNESIVYFSNKCTEIIAMAEKMPLNPAKNTTIEEEYPNIAALYYAMQEAYNNNPEDELILILFEQMVNIFANLDGFIIGTDANGLQTVTYGLNTFNLPIVQMNEQNAEALNLQNDLYTDYPTYHNLTQEVQQQVIGCAIFYNITANCPKDFSNSDDCKTKSGRIMARDLTLATVAYVTSAALCVGTGPAILFCEALAYGAYMLDVADAVKDHRQRSRLCELQGYF
jgi:hypothetical protein